MKLPERRSLIRSVAAPVLILGLASVTVAGQGTASDNCMDTDAALEYWRPIRAAAGESGQPADALALELVACLGSQDSELRDRIGYELLSYWLRRDRLTDETRRQLLAELGTRLADSAEDAALSRSFSALILSEIMRSDSMRPFMQPVERQDMTSE